MKGYNYKDWEIDFIRLALPLSNGSDIAKTLERTEAGVNAKIREMKIRVTSELKIGDRFGKLEIIERLANDEKRQKRWKCKCDCGKESNCSTRTLTSGHSKSCGCERLKAIYKGGEYITGTWFKHVKDSAQKRHIQFNLTIEFLDKLFIKCNKKCSLTGVPIFIKYGRTSKEYFQETTASLDRIDNNLGYIENNVQFVHKHINYMKWSHNQDYFIELCKKVAKYAESN